LIILLHIEHNPFCNLKSLSLRVGVLGVEISDMLSLSLINLSTLAESSNAFIALNSSGSKCLMAATIGELPIGFHKNAVLVSFSEYLDLVLLIP
jgi:hypothetical protein